MEVLSVYAEWFLHCPLVLGSLWLFLVALLLVIEPCVPFLGDHHGGPIVAR
jgi:hypothetical protein